MHLVPANHYTIDELTEIYNQTRIDYLVPMPMSTRRLQDYIDVYEVDLCASVVAVHEDSNLGLCMLGVRENRAWITRLGVLPNTRRHGAGRAMMEHVIEQAANQHLAVIYLEVIEGNTPAHKLFTRLGFNEIRNLLILRRPPGAPDAPPPAATTITLLKKPEVLQLAETRKERPAWTNQSESLANAGEVQGIYLINHTTESSGWISYQKTALQLKRVMIGSVNGTERPPAEYLLHELHSRFSALDTVAENVPADLPYLDAYLAYGYVESFARIEMELIF